MLDLLIAGVILFIVHYCVIKYVSERARRIAFRDADAVYNGPLMTLFSKVQFANGIHVAGKTVTGHDCSFFSHNVFDLARKLQIAIDDGTLDITSIDPGENNNYKSLNYRHNQMINLVIPPSEQVIVD